MRRMTGRGAFIRDISRIPTAISGKSFGARRHKPRPAMFLASNVSICRHMPGPSRRPGNLESLQKQAYPSRRTCLPRCAASLVHPGVVSSRVENGTTFQGEHRMTQFVREEIRDDLLSRGYSRRQMFRTAMMFAGGAAALSLNAEMASAADDDGAGGNMVRIGLNECWAGPMEPGLKAGSAALAKSNRYSPNGEIETLTKTISTIENIPEDHISIYPGSGGILSRAIVAYCSPTKGMVMADPSYNNVVRAAQFIKAPTALVPLTS